MYPEFEDIVPPKVTAYIAAGLSVVGLGLLTTVFGFSEKVVFLQEKYFLFLALILVAGMTGYWFHEALHYLVAYVLGLKPKITRWTFYLVPSAVSYTTKVHRRQFYAVVLAPSTGSLLGLLFLLFAVLAFSSIPLEGWIVFVACALATSFVGSYKDIAWFIGVYQRGWECIEEHPSGTAIRPCGTTGWWSARLPGPFERPIRLPGRRVGDSS